MASTRRNGFHQKKCTGGLPKLIKCKYLQYKIWSFCDNVIIECPLTSFQLRRAVKNGRNVKKRFTFMANIIDFNIYCSVFFSKKKKKKKKDQREKRRKINTPKNKFILKSVSFLLNHHEIIK